MADVGQDHAAVLDWVPDRYEGVVVTIKESMDVQEFVPRLKASLAEWRELNKRGVWIKLPIGHVHLTESIVKENFEFHHAEKDYLMLVTWLHECDSTIPANASHRVGVGAFVLNDKNEVLVVEENYGKSKGRGWKLPTGVVEEGKNVCDVAIKEVEEETGIKTEFLEVIAVRQSHQSFFTKSDLMFLCVLRPLSYEIRVQVQELEAAKWMPLEEYATLYDHDKEGQFYHTTQICLAKANGECSGFGRIKSKTSSRGKECDIYAPGIAKGCGSSI